MNPIEEQRTYVEFLESAVEEARSSGSAERIDGLEKLLKEARWEYARLKVNLQSGPVTESLKSPEVPPAMPPSASPRPLMGPGNKGLEVAGTLPVEPAVTVPAVPKSIVAEAAEALSPKPPVIVQSVPRKTALEGPSASTQSSDLDLKLTYDWEPRYKILLNNLKAAFSHEVKVYQITAHPIETNLVLESQPWYRSLLTNVKSIFSQEKKDYSRITSRPINTDLIIEATPWYLDIFSQLKSLFFKTEKPAIEITAQPVEVEDIFKEYKFRSTSVLFSTMLHIVGLVGILFFPMYFLHNTTNTKKLEGPEVLLEPSNLLLPPSPEKSGGGGGGGRRDPTPASQGRLPRPSSIQLTPPTPKLVNLDPILPAEPTVIVPQLAQLPSLNLPNYGDPNGIPGPPSSGPGTGGGIGTGTGGGVGPGKGGGVGPGEGGGIGGGVYRVGGGVTPPTVVFRVEPTYSEEARKAKYQGVVVLSAIVRKDGTIEILKVVRGLGLGLDENAIQALKQWKFRPGMRNGAPVDVALNIEVNFSLR
ncbi:MAG TPA: energy transducer TonB [Terriglobia bacterium]|nr:energy transducer TonB [Terriglobia bacterium]